ncbi:MAG: cytidylate kinase-like family protein [Clostridiales bacterium]|nr:cytidylate kinase-like family protein [Clostridiales bacterium]
MNRRIITISREFGSGGRSIGKQLAERLGYKYYDKELIDKLVEKTGYDKKVIEKEGEYAPGKNIFAYAFVGRTIDGMSVSDYLWKEQREMILEIAEKENCVIVGRCADYILRDRKDVLNVYIHADKEFRAKRIVELYGESDEKPVKRLEDKDAKRAVNYRYYTDRKWGMSQNYHIALDSGVLGMDKCVEMILSALSC